ncbi:hypothetical protein LCGC14_2429240 [marine sediment metagenome]|uniref:B30.2/SPRY domain-containing protein n=1 Tax=marine sediment metagenome TaxID=412755 RepID=A0A0F9BMK3_9ZZZZ
MSITWNPSDKHAGITLSLGNLRATTDDANGSGYWPVRATDGKSSGKWYFEIVSIHAYDFNYLGVANLIQSMASGQFPGSSANSWGYAAATGKKVFNSVQSIYGDVWTTGDVIGIPVDMDVGKIWFAKNNVWQAGGDPGAGTNEAFSGLSGTLYPMASAYGGFGYLMHTDIDLLLADMAYTPPSGFNPWEQVIYEEAVVDEVGLQDQAELMSLSEPVEDDIGLDDSVEVFSLTDAVEDDAVLDDAAASETIYEVEVEDGVGFDDPVDPDLTSDMVVSDEVGLGETAAVLNWAQWLAIYGSRVTARYYFTLTGTPDGLEDVVLPLSSFQYRLRDATPSYLQVVIPRITDAAVIAARANGDMIVEMAYLIDGVEQHREQLARVDFENVRVDKGTKNRSVTLTGHRTETWGAQIVTLTGITYQADYNGLTRVRIAMPDLWLRPGDTVHVGDEEFVAGQVLTAMSGKTQWTEVVEAA